MAIEYKAPNGSAYTISYQDLKSEYFRFASMTDSQFHENILGAIHLALAISWFKELGADMTIGDAGIVHELVHLMQGISDIGIDAVRTMFDNYLELV